MREYLAPLLFFQRFFLPLIVVLFLWAAWRTVRHRDMAVGLALYLSLVIIVDGFLNTGLFIPGLERGSIRYSEVCAVVLFFNRPRAVRRESPYRMVRFLVAVYFGLLLLSAFRSQPIMSGILSFRMVIVPQIVAFVIAMRGLESHDDLRRFFRGLMVLAIVIGLFVFWDLFFDRWLIFSEMLYKPEYAVNRRHGRFGGFFLNPNYLGAFTVLLFPATFVATLSEQTKKAVCLGGVAMLLLIFCLIETQSRGPVLAFGIVLPLLLVGPAGEISRKRRLGIFLPFLAVLVLLMPGFLEHASGRFDSLEQETATEARSRQTIWLYTQRLIVEHPLAGIGFGEQQFLDAMDRYGYEGQYGEQSLDNPHNSYLQMTVYAGFPTLIAFVVLNGLLLLRAGRFGLQKGTGAGIPFGMAVGVAGFLAVIYPDMHMFTQTVAPVYWVFVGLLLSATTASRPQTVVAAWRPRTPGVGTRQRPPLPRRYTPAAGRL